jgi:hypothetical protein
MPANILGFGDAINTERPAEDDRGGPIDEGDP